MNRPRIPRLVQRRRLAVLSIAVLAIAMTAPAVSGATGEPPPIVEHFTTLPIEDTDNPCGSAVGSAEGFGVVTLRERTDGSTRVVTRYLGHFDVDLTGDPVINAWDPEATAAAGVLSLRVVEDSAEGFKVKLRIWGETDTGVNARLFEKTVVRPDGSGYTVWNCYDGSGRHRVDF